MICKNCLYENDGTGKFCVKCGSKLEAEPVFEPEVSPVQPQEEQFTEPQAQPEPEQVYTQQPIQPQQAQQNQYYNYNQNQSQNYNYNQRPQEIPHNYAPISPWGYFGYQLLFSIPIAGLILLIIFSFSNDNINRRNFARSYWCALLIALIICVVFGLFAALVTFMLYTM